MKKGFILWALAALSLCSRRVDDANVNEYNACVSEILENVNDVLFADNDDYDNDGTCETFVLLGRIREGVVQDLIYGQFWFVGADGCERLPSYGCYRQIPGLMKFGENRKYIYLHTDLCVTATISELWTVEDGKPLESAFSGINCITHRGGNEFELTADGYDHLYDIEDEMYTGHTWKPYFLHYVEAEDGIVPYEGKLISREELKDLCGQDLAAEIEAEGCALGEIILWENGIVTVNYSCPLEVDGETSAIDYENIIWDCETNDYWRKEERHVTSWKSAGEGGIYHLGYYDIFDGKPCL